MDAAGAGAIETPGVNESLPRHSHGLAVKRSSAWPAGLLGVLDEPTLISACDYERRLVDQNSAIWNQVAVLLSRIDALRLGA